jgi:hypothetical protein
MVGKQRKSKKRDKKKAERQVARWIESRRKAEKVTKTEETRDKIHGAQRTKNRSLVHTATRSGSLLKGSLTRDFQLLVFFHKSVSPQGPEYPIGATANFV